MSTATSFTCPECQRTLRTPSPVAPGKKIRCPACNTIFAPTMPDPRPASPIRRQEDAYPPPAPARRSLDDEDDHPRRPRRRPMDDEDWQEDRPRRRAKKGSALPFILAGSAALLLLIVIGIGGFIWPGWFLGDSGGRLAGQPSEVTASLLGFMPADPMVIAGADLSRLQKRNKLDDLLTKLPQQIGAQAPGIPPGLRNMLNDVEAVVVAADGADSSVFAVKSKAAIKKEDLVRELKAVEKDVQGKKIYRIPGDGRDVHAMIDSSGKILVVSPTSEADFVRMVNNHKGPTGECRTLVDKVGGAAAWCVIQIKGEIKQAVDMGMNQAAMFGGGAGNPKAQQNLNTFRQAKAMVVWLNSTDTVTLNFGFVLATAGDAARLRRDFNDEWNRDTKQQLKNMGPLFAGFAPGGQGQVVTAVINDVADTLKVESEGTLMWMSATFSNNTTQQLVQFAEQNLGKLANFGQGAAFDNKIGGVPPPFPPPKFDKGFKLPKDGPAPIPPPVAGKQVLRQDGTLTQFDPKDKVLSMPHKLHLCRMTAGKTYQIDMTSNWDNEMRLEDLKGLELARNDDGVSLNARIVFTPARTDTYRIIASTHTGQVGRYVLTVHER